MVEVLHRGIEGVDMGVGGGMSSTISGTCWMCMHGGLSLDPVRFEIGAAGCGWRLNFLR